MGCIRLLGLHDMDNGVDECQVPESLRKVAHLTSTHRINLFGVEPKRTCECQELLAELAALPDLANLHQSRDQPERADREAPFRTTQPVIRVSVR
jgi:hypothetical protein